MEISFEKLDPISRVINTQELFRTTWEYYDQGHWWEDANGNYHGFIAAMQLARGYFKGDKQWSDQVKAQFREDKSGRMAAVYNRISQSIHLISGLERMSRTETRVLPAIAESDNSLADIVNPLLKYVRKDQRTSEWSSEAFQDVLITGAANFELGLKQKPGKFNDDIDVAFIPAEFVLWDPSSRLIDRSDAQFCFQYDWLSKKQFDMTYGDVPDVEEIMHRPLEGQVEPSENISHETKDDYRERLTQMRDVAQSVIFQDDTKKTIRRVRAWRKTRKQVWIVKVEETGVETVWQNKDDADAHLKGLAEKGIEASKREGFDYNISYQCICGAKEIEFQESISINEIPVKSLYAKFDPITGYFWGVPYEVKDNQEIQNSLWSTLLTFIKNMPKGTTMAEEDALLPESEQKLIEGRGFIHGLFLKFKKGALTQKKFIYEFAPGMEKIPYFVELIAKNEDHMQHASRARDVLEGQAPNDVKSGIGLQILRQQGTTLLQDLFDHFNWWKDQVSLLTVKLFALMDPAYLQKICLGNLEKQDSFIPDEQAENPADTIKTKWQQLFERLKHGDFQFSTVQMAYNPSEQMTRLMILTDMASKGIAVPPQLLIDNTPLDEQTRDKWKQYIQVQMAQQMAAAPAPGDVTQSAAKVQQPKPA